MVSVYTQTDLTVLVSQKQQHSELARVYILEENINKCSFGK